MDGTILVADDDRTIRTVLTQALTRAGCKVHATSSLTTLLRWVAEGRGDAVITDVMMPDGNGLEMLPKIAQDRPDLPVIVISAQNSIMTAIKAAEADAFDYLPKPFDLPDLMKRTARALENRRHVAGAGPRPTPEEGPSDTLPLIGRTPAMQGLYRLVVRVMNADLPMLISGESGTGKSLVARVMHDFSDRRGRPFVTVTAGDLNPPDGPERIISRAKGGTILFDEISRLNTDAQVKIVHMMDASDEQAPRFMATAQSDLTQEMEAGRLLQDLYYRLDGAAVSVPPLRERVDDIPLLAEHFLAQGEHEAASPRMFSQAALELMRAYSWPGNVRQLENAVRRLGLTAQTGEIGRGEVETLLGNQPGAATAPGIADGDRLSASVARHVNRYFDLHGDMLPPAGLYARILREVEMPLIEIALDATSGNQAKCADLLGINRNTLRKKITELDIRVTRRRKLM
ncbi:response regulator [Aquicoccus sp. G2-2]|uniref:response regulator n=1 Tax=Aquicoccus sp. G2-2 TaxID=3092120 RepID=UPI002ADF1F75|nr:response regulator [Aquicoccus sp. G2-2]MEA1113157.1 response regulator [Aquicoccus sp. G2-2]